MRSVSRMAVLMLCGAVMTAGAVACSSASECSNDSGSLQESDGSCLRFGVSTPNGPLAVGETAAVAESVGVDPSLVLSFHDFAAVPPIGQLDAVAATGASSILTWEPWRHYGGDDYDRGAFTMASIVAGKHDDYLYRWADELVAHAAVVYLRFAHEPNGTWYPWSPMGGTSPDTYVAAWRHVHDLFMSKGATNVKWVWAPNVPVAEEIRPMSDWYPGIEYVDVIGVDGYNWGTSAPGHRWTSPYDLFGSAFDELRALAPGTPLLVTEVGSAEEGGSKADWIEEFVAYLDAEQGATGFVWFEQNKEADWRLNSTEEAAAAMGRALRKAGLS
ncbi:endoglucanase [Rhodococcus sp. P1Y]|nr:endoglucanase [Rhodococcus sp. P1Y]